MCFNIFVLGSVVSSFTVITTCNLASWILTCRLKSQGLRRCIEIKGLRGSYTELSKGLEEASARRQWQCASWPR